MSDLVLYNANLMAKLENNCDDEQRDLDIKIAQEIFGLHVSVVSTGGIKIYYATSFNPEDKPEKIEVFNPDFQLRFYSSRIEEALKVAEKVLGRVDKRQSSFENPKTREIDTGYGGVFNLQMVSLPWGGVTNWQADFAEIGKKGPIESTKCLGVSKDPAHAVCMASLAAWKKERNYVVPKRELKDVTDRVNLFIGMDPVKQIGDGIS